MKMSPTWKRGKAGHKKHRAAYKPKIRWEVLGLSDPEMDESPASIESIREQVSALARKGFGLKPSTGETIPTGRAGRNRPITGKRIGRRGATE